MNSRERVLTAIDHREPDRLPMFRPNDIKTYEPYPAPLQEFLDAFEFDRLAGVGGIVGGPSTKRELPGEVFEDSYGCRFQYKGVGLPYCIHSPLADAETVADVERFPWPDPEAPGLVRPDARERAREVHERGEFATAVGVEMLFHRYEYLRGFEQHFLDLKLNPDLHRAIADHVHHLNTTMVLRLLEEVGDYVDLVTTGDDLGSSTAPYVSPEDFRRHFKPYYADLVGRVKARWPHVRFYLHSHGQIMPLVPDLIECGVDVLNPVLPLDNMDPVVLKRDFGDRLAFEGGIDIERIVPFGTLAEVEEHTKHVIDLLAPGGGYLFKAQAISALMPPENIIRTYEVAVEHGAHG